MTRREAAQVREILVGLQKKFPDVAWTRRRQQRIRAILRRYFDARRAERPTVAAR